jgi:hypothetical protein
MTEREAAAASGWDVDDAFLERFERNIEKRNAEVAALSRAPQAVRMLTEEEIEAAWNDAARTYRQHRFAVRGQMLTAADSESWHEAQALQRKFCEVNGIVPPAPQEEGGK